MYNLTQLADRIRPRLLALYGSRADWCWERLDEVFQRYSDLPQRRVGTLWDQRDIMLITYGDQIRNSHEAPLVTLGAFLKRHALDQVFSLVHILPFFPATSDDGFSVRDYRIVDPDLGSWSDIQSLGNRVDLMFDLVLNHASRSSDWFQKYLKGIDPYTNYFVEADKQDNLQHVVRPRTSPLLTPIQTSRGVRRVWTTFSDDQIDLNFAEPAVLVEMVDILLAYVRNGARILRLDAVAFLWKEPGTKCVHLPQTHWIVRLLRDVVEAIAPGTLLLTETNVPHDENISYWGDADEAHLIYNFSLPPLLLDAFLSGDATYFQGWLSETPSPPPGTSALNFTASHDGIGVRPLEKLVPEERVKQLVAAVESRGGLVTWRTGLDGRELPYELNITWFDALSDPSAPRGGPMHIQRFLASQTVMLSLKGIPTVYFHSLLGTTNDLEGVRRSGRARSINRQKFDLSELERRVATGHPSHTVWRSYCKLLAARRNVLAFHPDGGQETLRQSNPSVIAWMRRSPDHAQAILVAANVSDRAQSLDLRQYALRKAGKEILSGTNDDPALQTLLLQPYQVVWQPTESKQ